MRALGKRRIGLVSPYSEAVNRRAADLFARKHGLETVALEGFGATNSYTIGDLGPENARDAFARIDRPEIEVLVVPGGNFPTMAAIAGWEREFGKPVVTTNQASFWAMLTMLNTGDKVPGYGRLLRRDAGGIRLIESLFHSRLRGLRNGLLMTIRITRRVWLAFRLRRILGSWVAVARSPPVVRQLRIREISLTTGAPPA